MCPGYAQTWVHCEGRCMGVGRRGASGHAVHGLAFLVYYW